MAKRGRPPAVKNLTMDDLYHQTCQTALVAMEFGYKAAERGESIDQARLSLLRTIAKA